MMENTVEIKNPSELIGKWVLRCPSNNTKYALESPIKILAIVGPEGFRRVVCEQFLVNTFYDIDHSYTYYGEKEMGKVREITYMEDARYWLENQCSGNQKLTEALRDFFKKNHFSKPVPILDSNVVDGIKNKLSKTPESSEKIKELLSEIGLT